MWTDSSVGTGGLVGAQKEDKKEDGDDDRNK
jgi:hypothetical protein